MTTRDPATNWPEAIVLCVAIIVMGVAFVVNAFVEAKRAPIDPFPDDDYPTWKVGPTEDEDRQHD